MKPTTRMGILAAACLAAGACALAQGPEAGQPAGNRPQGMPPEMRAERPGAQPGMMQPQPGMPQQHPGMQPQRPEAGMMDREHLRQAGASDAQIQALQELVFAQREKQIDLRAKQEKAQLAMERLMTSTNADEKAVLAAADTLNQAQGELMKLELSTQLKRKQILGEELLHKLQTMRPQRPEGRMPGMGGPNAPGGANAGGPMLQQGKGPRGQGQQLEEGQRPMPPPPPMGAM